MNWWQSHKMKINGVIALALTAVAVYHWFQVLFFAAGMSTPLAANHIIIALGFSFLAAVGWVSAMFAKPLGNASNHCPKPGCGYNLTGNTSGVCPECGTASQTCPTCGTRVIK